MSEVVPVRSKIPVPLVIVSLFATALAGCLSATTEGESTISRVHTLTFSKATTEAAEAKGDDPAAALRELLTTDLVVRVSADGDYVLEYTDASGAARTHALTGATAATPVVITGADPLAPATLKRGDEIVSVRGGIVGDWWHVGDMPLGFNLTQGSKTTYDLRSRVQETLTLNDLDVDEQGIRLDALRFDLNLPMEGRASWELQPDTGDGAPVLLTANLAVPAGAGDLLTVDIAAQQNGAPGTAGVVAGVDQATVSGSAKLWVRDGEPVAAQFLGGEAKIAPRVTMWADGFFGDLAEGASCAGTTKADRCSPEELEAQEMSEPAGEKEVFDAADFPKAEDDEERAGLALMQRLFAQDILPGDKGMVIVRADSSDFPADPSAPTGDFLLEFTIEAVGVEDLTIAAGTFRALKIVEETRTRANLRDLQGPDGQTLVSDFSMDETVARTTMWLDASTYQPLKMEASTPFDAEAVLKSALDSIAPSAWDTLGGDPLTDEQWSFTVLAESRYEAVELAPGAHFSALVGLTLAHALMGSAGSNAMTASWFGMDDDPFYPGGDDYTWEEPAERAPVSLSMSSAGPAADGVKSYAIASASPWLTWEDLELTVDGMWLGFEFQDECGAPSEGYVVCRDGMPLDPWEDILAGDQLTLVAEPGQTLRVMDAYSSSVVMTLVVN